MADTKFLTNDAQTRKKWSRELFKVVLPDVEFNGLIGTGSESIVQMKTELGKGEGDYINMDIRLPLTGQGRVGDDSVEGNEEKLIFKDFNITIEELNHAVNTGGKMNEQRVPYDLMVEGKNALQDWWADKLSDLIFAHLCGDTTFRIADQTFAQNPTAPDSDHLMVVNGKTETTMTPADKMGLKFLDAMKQRARLPNNTEKGFKIRPIRLKGKMYYRVILHDYVFDRLRENTNAAEWGDMLRAANKLGDPLTEFVYNGMMVSKSERITQVQDNVYRNVLLGAQSACVAWGGAGESKSTTMSFVPYTSDAKRFMNIRGGGILGIKRTVFQDQDYGIVVGSSHATALVG